MFVPDIADAERMSEVITAHADELGLAPRVGPCRLLDARIRHSHRPSSPRCQGWATYSVPTNGEPAALLYVRGYPASAQPWGELVAAGRAGGAIHLPEYDLIVWKFPEDPSLPSLPQLVDPTRIVGLLPTARVMPDELHVDVVRYQPETSATLRCRVAGGREPVTLYVKAVNADPTGIGTVHERLWDRSTHLPDLRIARPLGWDPVLQVLWTLGVPGAAFGGRVDPSAAAAIAGTVAALHNSGVPVPHVVRVEDQLAEGRKKASKLAAALPRCQPTVAAIAPPDSRYAGSPPRAVVHGDLHLDQLIAGPDGPVLVDLDSVAAGDAELDLAELVVDVVMRSLPLPAVQAFVLELLEAYEREAPARPIRLGLLRALADAEFLTRCHRSLRRRAPGWEIELEQALAQHADLATVLPSP